MKNFPPKNTVSQSHQETFKVKKGDIDVLNHVNNVVYLQWVNDIAEKHWEILSNEEINKKYFWVAIRHEIDYLQQAFLINKVNRTDIQGKKVFSTNEKYYFEDWGIKNAIIGIENFEISQVIENVVYIHQKSEGYNINVGVSANKEIDFVCQKDGLKIYIQACYLLNDDKVKEREFGNLLEIKDNYPKIVVSLDKYAPSNMEGVKHIYLRDFLSK